VDGLTFGTENLRDDISKLVHICTAINGGKIPEEGGYKSIRLSNIATTDDEVVIDFFTKELGNKRKSIAFVTSAGLRKLYSEVLKYPTSIFQMRQVLGEIARIDEVDYIIQDRIRLRIPTLKYELLDSCWAEIPKELWGMICGVSRTLGLHPVHAFMYLIRTGVAEYNDFVSSTSFSSQVEIKLKPRLLKSSVKSGEIFLHTFGRIYKRLLNTIIDLDDECKNNKYYTEDDEELVADIEKIRKENSL
jgi:hypothetical protein